MANADVRRAAAVKAGLTRVAHLSPAQKNEMAANARRAQREKLEREAIEADASLADDPEALADRVRTMVKLKMADMALRSAQAKARQAAEREDATLDALLAGGDQ